MMYPDPLSLLHPKPPTELPIFISLLVVLFQTILFEGAIIRTATMNLSIKKGKSFYETLKKCISDLIPDLSREPVCTQTT